MTTIVNSPTPSSEEGSGMGILIGIIITVVLLVLVYMVYGLPGTNNAGNSASSGTNNAASTNTASSDTKSNGYQFNVNGQIQPPKSGTNASTDSTP